jgi:hypothetical protein
MPANAGVFTRSRMAGRGGRPTTENRGVPSSNLGLGHILFCLLTARFLVCLWSAYRARFGAIFVPVVQFVVQNPRFRVQ